MTIELSNIPFTDQDDIVPASGVEQILNTGVVNTLAGNDRITGTGSDYRDYGDYGFENVGTLNTDDGNDTITGIAGGPYNFNAIFDFGISNSGTLNTARGDDVITGRGYIRGIVNSGIFNTGEGNDKITANGFRQQGALHNTDTFNTGEGNDTITAEGGEWIWHSHLRHIQYSRG